MAAQEAAAAEQQEADNNGIGGSAWVPVEEDGEETPNLVADKPSVMAESPNGGRQGLALSRSPLFEKIQAEQDDDDDVEPMAASPLASLSRGGVYDQNAEGDETGDLISRDLLNELGNDQDDWNQGHGPETSPHGGFDTPSEPNTPSPRGTPRNAQYSHWGNQQNDGFNCAIDQWDWKTDAPEFVPGGMKDVPTFTDHSQVQQQQQQQQAYQQPWAPMQQQQPVGNVGRGGGDGGPPDNAKLSQLRANYDWQLRTKSNELRDMQQCMNQVEIETAQVRASWEIERRGLLRQIGHYRAVLERYCIPIEEAGAPSYNMEDAHSGYFPAFEPSAPSQWPSAPAQPVAAAQASPGNDRSFGGMPQQGMFGAGAGAAAAGGGPAPADGGGAKSSLDSKMQQLNNLLQEGNASTNRNRQPSDSPPNNDGGDQDPQQEGGGYSGVEIASTLRAMFPHATIRTKSAPEEDRSDDEGEPGSPEALDHDLDGPPLGAAVPPPPAAPRMNHDGTADVTAQWLIDDLQSTCQGQIDERAMRALEVLGPKEQLDALMRVEELVQQQGGQCRNLSSILQSVCRKIEKSEKRRPKAGQGPDDRPSNGDGRSSGDRGSRNRDGGDPPARGSPEARGKRRTRQQDEDGDAFDSSESEGDAKAAHSSSWPQEFERAAGRSPNAKASGDGGEVPPSPGAREKALHATPGSQRSKSWADIQSGDENEDDGGPGFGDSSMQSQDKNDPWTTQKIENAAKRGFDLRRRGDHWDLKIYMAQLDPPLTHLGMERYCRWLRVRLTAFREEHGNDALWKCRGEVDFSHDNLTNEMAWMLLETLAQHEVHTAMLKLFGNRISQGGVLALCEFIRQNEKAEALQELHLSHNEIDDESALELLRTIKSKRPRYPPRRAAEGSGEFVLAPVWVRLNHNRIRDPAQVLRVAEDEGITMCTAWDRQVCGTSKCVRRDCPLVHLYSFQVQDMPKHERHDKKNGKDDREGRDNNKKDQGRDRRDGGRDRRRGGSKKDQEEGSHQDKDPLWDGPSDHANGDRNVD